MGASLTVAAATKTAQASSDVTGVSQTGGDGGTTAGNEGGGPTPTGVDPKAQESEPTWPPDLGGLELDGPNWRSYQGPTRLRECILSPEEKQKCQEIIAKVFRPDTIMGVKVLFHPDDVIFVMNRVQDYLKEEPMLIEDLPLEVQVVGDLYGQLYDLDRIFKVDMKDGKPGWEHSKYLFLGNYVDRGRQSLEIIMALFSMKMLYPDNVFLLRGNHEFIKCNIKYFFREDMHLRFGDKETAELLFIICNEAFCFLSIAAIVGNKYFCSHGGISPSSFTRRQFRGIKKPKVHSNEDVLMHDTICAEPAIGLQGSFFNGTSIYFGMDALVHALFSMQVLTSVRAHTKVPEGFANTWNLCFTVFSATDNVEAGNKGATAIIDAQGKISFRTFEVDKPRSVFEKAVRRVERKKFAELRGKVLTADDEKNIVKDDDDYGCVGIKNFL